MLDHEKSRLSVNEREEGRDVNRQSLLRNSKVFVDGPLRWLLSDIVAWDSFWHGTH